MFSTNCKKNLSNCKKTSSICSNKQPNCSIPPSNCSNYHSAGKKQPKLERKPAKSCTICPFSYIKTG